MEVLLKIFTVWAVFVLTTNALVALVVLFRMLKIEAAQLKKATNQYKALKANEGKMTDSKKEENKENISKANKEEARETEEDRQQHS